MADAEKKQYKIMLYVKGSQVKPGERFENLEADNFCHRVMMLLRLKGVGAERVQVFPVDYVKKHNVSSAFPVKLYPTLAVYPHTGEVDIDRQPEFSLDDVDEIEAFVSCLASQIEEGISDEDFNAIVETLTEIFKKLSKNDRLKLPAKLNAEAVPQTKQEKEIASFVDTSTLYSKFQQYIKNNPKAAEKVSDEMLKNNLVLEFKKLNSFLLSEKMKERPFLNGDKPGLLDCNLLPKLHYMYVALGVVKEFNFESWSGIEGYLNRGREVPEFVVTCPKKADIVNFFCMKAGCNQQVANQKVSQVGLD